jgi:hypothetical protein
LDQTGSERRNKGNGEEGRNGFRYGKPKKIHEEKP